MSDHIIKALGNTLMHSLWQGILLAVITGAIILFTKKASAAFRYNLLVGAMMLFALGATATFMVQLQKPAALPTAVAPATITVSSSANTAAPIVQQTGTRNFTETVINYFNTHYNTVVLIWFLIICAKSVQMAVGLHGVSHLKRTKAFKVAEEWENRLLQLAKQLHIEQAVWLMESGIAKVPMVVGHLKPVILIPIGLINSLPTNEVEAILIHELAHIHRRDYLVNLLQSFMEIVFFFNPAVLWISQLIKTERENCCDDLTIAQSRNKENYIRAMLSCEEYQAAVGAYAMAFPGARNTLRDRVTRIVYNRNYSLSLFEKTMLAVCLVVMGLGISAFTARESIKSENNKSENNKSGNNKPGNNKPENTKKTPPPAVPVIHYAARAVHISRLRRPALTPPAANPDTNKPALEISRAIARELYREQLLVDTDHLTISLNDRELIVNGVRMAQEVYERIYRRFGRGGDGHSDNYGNPDAYYQSLAEDRKKAEDNIDKILVADLLQDGLITNPKNVTFSLSDKTLMLNGKKQSDEMYKKYKEKYRPGNTGSGWSWNYTNHE